MTVKTKQQVLALLQKHHADLRRLGMKRCGLFGSFVRDEQQEMSDVDILFEPGQKTFDHFMQLAFFLEALFERNVDLVTTEALSPYIGPSILREVAYASVSA